MKAVILAAGRGTRISSVTHGVPKCLLSIGSFTFLDFQIKSLFRAGVDSLVIVVGYDKEKVVGHVKRHHADRLAKIEFVENPDFATTNNMYSLWQARGHLIGERFLCLNADVLCHPDLLVLMTRARGDITILVDPEYREETTKVRAQEGRIVELTKQLNPAECWGTFVGIAAFSSAGAQELFEWAEREFAAGRRNQFYNDIISLLAAAGRPVEWVGTNGLPWAEVDDPDDLRFAQNQVFPAIESVLLAGNPVRD